MRCTSPISRRAGACSPSTTRSSSTRRTGSTRALPRGAAAACRATGSSGAPPTSRAPVDVSGELRERLWDAGPTAILVSATLTTGDDARFVRRRLGLEAARELVVGSPYDFREQALLYVPRTMPDPRAEGFSERAADEV